MTPKLRQLREDASPHLAAIQACCTPDSKILVVVVFPDEPAQNWCLGNATVEEAVKGLQWLAAHGENRLAAHGENTGAGPPPPQLEGVHFG